MNLRKAFLLISMLASACTGFDNINSSDAETPTEKTPVSFNISRVSQSFVYIESTLDLARSVCDSDGKCVDQSESISAALGSGMTVKHKGRTYIITAGHVCVPQAYDEYLSMISYFGTISNSIIGTGYFGNTSDLTILAVNVERDACILEAKERWVSPGLKLAKRLPKQGAKVCMISAPFGVFEPGMTLAYDGYLAGADADGDILVSMPTRPGTSGSAILDERERVVGIIHSAFSMMESIGIGTPVDVIHDLFDKLE